MAPKCHFCLSDPSLLAHFSELIFALGTRTWPSQVSSSSAIPYLQAEARIYIDVPASSSVPDFKPPMPYPTPRPSLACISWGPNLERLPVLTLSAYSPVLRSSFHSTGKCRDCCQRMEIHLVVLSNFDASRTQGKREQKDCKSWGLGNLLQDVSPRSYALILQKYGCLNQTRIMITC